MKIHRLSIDLSTSKIDDFSWLEVALASCPAYIRDTLKVQKVEEESKKLERWKGFVLIDSSYEDQISTGYALHIVPKPVTMSSFLSHVTKENRPTCKIINTEDPKEMSEALRILGVSSNSRIFNLYWDPGDNEIFHVGEYANVFKFYNRCIEVYDFFLPFIRGMLLHPTWNTPEHPERQRVVKYVAKWVRTTKNVVRLQSAFSIFMARMSNPWANPTKLTREEIALVSKEFIKRIDKREAEHLILESVRNTGGGEKEATLRKLVMDMLEAAGELSPTELAVLHSPARAGRYTELIGTFYCPFYTKLKNRKDASLWSRGFACFLAKFVTAYPGATEEEKILLAKLLKEIVNKVGPIKELPRILFNKDLIGSVILNRDGLVKHFSVTSASKLINPILKAALIERIENFLPRERLAVISVLRADMRLLGGESFFEGVKTSNKVFRTILLELALKKS